MLETVDKLFERYNVIIPSICSDILYVRSDWQSAFLSHLELHAAAPALSHTSGWPYFAGAGPIELMPADCYLACVVTFIELLAPVPFKKLQATGTRHRGSLTPL